MRKLLFSLLAIAMTVPAINAQETVANEPIYTHSWRDNWYIQLGAGAQMHSSRKMPVAATSTSTRLPPCMRQL